MSSEDENSIRNLQNDDEDGYSGDDFDNTEPVDESKSEASDQLQSATPLLRVASLGDSLTLGLPEQVIPKDETDPAADLNTQRKEALQQSLPSKGSKPPQKSESFSLQPPSASKKSAEKQASRQSSLKGELEDGTEKVPPTPAAATMMTANRTQPESSTAISNSARTSSASLFSMPEAEQSSASMKPPTIEAVMQPIYSPAQPSPVAVTKPPDAPLGQLTLAQLGSEQQEELGLPSPEGSVSSSKYGMSFSTMDEETGGSNLPEPTAEQASAKAMQNDEASPAPNEPRSSMAPSVPLTDDLSDHEYTASFDKEFPPGHNPRQPSSTAEQADARKFQPPVEPDSRASSIRGSSLHARSSVQQRDLDESCASTPRASVDAGSARSSGVDGRTAQLSSLDAITADRNPKDQVPKLPLAKMGAAKRGSDDGSVALSSRASSISLGFFKPPVRMTPPAAPRSWSVPDDYDNGPTLIVVPAKVDDWDGELRPQPTRSKPPLSSVSGPSTPVIYEERSQGAEQVQVAGMEALKRRDVETWSVLDVADWLDYISLGQHRSMFLQRQVDGSLLLALTESPEAMEELGVTVVAEKVALTDSVKELKAIALEGRVASGMSGRPASSRLAPSTGSRPYSAYNALRTPGRPRPLSTSRATSRMSAEPSYSSNKETATELRARLAMELQKAQVRAEQRRVLSGPSSNATIAAEEEVRHLAGMIADLDRQAADSNVGSTSPRSELTNRSRPWSSAPGPSAQSTSAPRGRPQTAYSHRPTINPNSRKILQDSRGGESNGSDFLSRLNNDLRRRMTSRDDLTRRFFDMRVGKGDTLMMQKQMSKDYEFVKDLLEKRFGTSLGDSVEENREAIDAVFESQADLLQSAGLKPSQFEAVQKAQGPKKVQLAAGALRTLVFMERYKSELNQREGKLKELEAKYWEEVMGKGKADESSGVREYFTQMGWESGTGHAHHVKALIKRAQAYKKEVDAWKEKNRDRVLAGTAGPSPGPNVIDWSQPMWTQDGLNQLMAMAASRANNNDAGAQTKVSRAWATRTARMGDPLSNAVKLLGQMTVEDLAKLEREPSLIATYKALRTQEFIEYTQTDLKTRHNALEKAYVESGPRRLQVASSRVPAFMERLSEDLMQRRARMETLRMQRLTKEVRPYGAKVS